MFEEFITTILGNERELIPNHQESTTPDVIEKSSTQQIHSKYSEDTESLEQRYGSSFGPGLCIEIDLPDLLELCPRERRRIDSYRGLVSYLTKSHGVELKIKSQKTKEAV